MILTRLDRGAGEAIGAFAVDNTKLCIFPDIQATKNPSLFEAGVNQQEKLSRSKYLDQSLA